MSACAITLQSLVSNSSVVFSISHSAKIEGPNKRAGREEEGQAQARQVLRIDPRFSSSANPYLVQYKDPAQREQFVTLFRKAGLPE